MSRESSAISANERRSTWGLSMILAGVPLCVSGLMVGGGLASSLTMSETINAALVGSLILTMYASLIGAIGAKTGLPTTPLIRQVVGGVGAKLLAIVIAVCLCGWYAFQVDFFGQTINHLLPNGGFITSPKVAAFWGGILMMSSALFGYRGLAILSTLAIPLIVGLASWGLSESITGDIWAATPKEPQSFGNAVSVVVGSFAIGATINSDITRFAKGVPQSFIATSVGFFLANIFILVCGAATLLATGSSDLVSSMVTLGFGASGLLILILGQWTTNDNNLYSATVNISEAFPGITKPALVCSFGLIATLLGVGGVINIFVPFLLWLGLIIPPIGGILISYYLILGEMTSSPMTERMRSIIALTAWLGGTLAGKFITIGIPALNAVLVSIVIFLVGAKIIGRRT